MIETILSTYGDRESAKTVLETHSTYRDLAFEFCNAFGVKVTGAKSCLLYTSPSPRDRQKSRMPSSA